MCDSYSLMAEEMKKLAGHLEQAASPSPSVNLLKEGTHPEKGPSFREGLTKAQTRLCKEAI